MKQDEIIELAKLAGVSIRGHYDETGSTPRELAAFAKLVSAKEREACAKICEEQYDYYGYDHVFAAAIRARG